MILIYELLHYRSLNNFNTRLIQEWKLFHVLRYRY